MTFNNRSLMILAGLVAAPATFAQVTIDGSLTDAAYGAPFAVQNCETGFGDNDLNFNPFATGSEADQLFAAADANNIYIGIAGNLETNYNKFVLFFDSKAGGQNELLPGQPDGDFNFLGNFTNSSGTGFTFDAGFEADFAINVTNGDNAGTYNLYYTYFRVGNNAAAPDGWGFQGPGLFPNLGGIVTGGNGNVDIRVTIDNSNTGGVSASSSSGAGVTTGAEISIPKSFLQGQCDIKVVAMLTGGGGFISNQVLPGIGAGQGNLGGPAGVSLATVPGNQYITLYPSVKGTLSVGGYTAPYSSGAALFVDGNGNQTMGTISVAADGSYTACGPFRGGQYTMYVRSQSSLWKAVAVDTTGGGITGVNLGLINGDIDGNNEVGPGDFAQLALAFGSEVGGPGYTAAADLDGNEEIGPSDFAILANNFGAEGDAP